MTPQEEKARELFYKALLLKNDEGAYLSIEWTHAKVVASFVVDEIHKEGAQLFEAMKDRINDKLVDDYEESSHFMFWQKVKILVQNIESVVKGTGINDLDKAPKV